MEKQKRLLSVDALRGFDMLLISGGGAFILRLKGTTGLSWIDWTADQLTHPAWNGFTFYDFIFPLFLFTAGIALSYSIRSGLSRGMNKKELYRKAFRRMLILIVLGILDKNIPLNIFDPAQIRYGTVLGRIGIATFITTLLYVNLSSRQRLYWVGGMLIVYCAALFLVPVPGYGAGDLSFEGNLVGWFDRHFMPGRLLQKIYDENALLTQLPAHCLTVLGAFAGDILQKQKSEYKKLLEMGIMGVAGICAGLLWSTFFPLNKHLWTSSFILLTAGMAFLFLALFYWIIDVQGYRKWAFFFKVIGMNSLVIYLGMRFIDFDYSSKLLFGGWYMHVAEKWQPACNALGALILVWLLLYFLYRKKIFVKV
ncbi:acyltransferase family protein [Agriterribacter humi]|uniref:acyltransferase family protein n=1 Tax=Agriterribacter humi TaxID=1104781 RepID=UPI00126422C0|nr:DUF5009 domain-containing protein [Agriterribacter humi]